MANFIFVYCHLFGVSFSRARISFRSVLSLGLFLSFHEITPHHATINTTPKQQQQLNNNNNHTTPLKQQLQLEPDL